MKKKIGIFGGTFNPIHIGHLYIAQMAVEKCQLDQVVFVPAARNPLKSTKGLVSSKDRLKMTRLAIGKNPYFDVSDFEVRRGGKSFAIDTIRHFKEKYENDKLYFVIGGDTLETLSTWKDIEEINKLVTFVVLHRPGSELKKTPYRTKLIPLPGLNISSTYLRRKVRVGGTVSYLLPGPVRKYIKDKNLY